MLLAGWFVMIRDWIISARWTKTDGIVRGVLVEPARQSDHYRPWQDRQGFRPVIRYAYTVDEQTYVGSRYSATREPFFPNEDEAAAFVTKFPLRSRLPVRVNPDNAKLSLLERRLSPADALPGYLGLGCLFVGILAL